MYSALSLPYVAHGGIQRCRNVVVVVVVVVVGQLPHLQRWSEHFGGLSSDRRTVQESSLAEIPQVNVKLELDDPPTREEIRKATMQLKVGKR